MIPRVAANITRRELGEILKVPSRSYAEIVDDLERSFRSHLGFKKTFFLNSGTAALYAALNSIGVEGKEVLAPAYTCGSVIEAILLAGGKPVLVDADIRTFNISLEDLKEKVTGDTRAVVVVDLFGNPVDYYELRDILEPYGVYVVEDAAQALGAKYDRRYVGCFGDAAVFSFGLGKGITGGGGGALVVNSGELVDRVEEFYNELKTPSLMEDSAVLARIFPMYLFSNKNLYGLAKPWVEELTTREDSELVKRIFELLSGNRAVREREIERFCKISKFSAVAVLGQIARLKCIVERRRINAKYLLSNLDLTNCIDFQKCPELGVHAYSRFGVVINCLDRKAVRRELARKGVDSEEMYGYMKKIYEAMGYTSPNATVLSEHILCLPVHGKLALKDLDFIVASFNQLVSSRKL